MNSVSKNSNTHLINPGAPDQNGSAMTVVILFAAISMLTVLSYVFHQMSYSKPSLRSPSELQARFNARSGIYKAFYELIDSLATDTLPTLSPLDEAFGSTMFDDIVTAQSPYISEKPTLDGDPVTYTLFSDSTSDTINTCEVTLEPRGGELELTSKGTCHAIERTVSATLGSRIPALPDTVVLYRNSLPWDGNEPDGTIISTVDSSSYNSMWYNQVIDRYQTEITDTDTFLLDPPLIIQSRHDLDKIKPVIYGPLMIDGAHVELVWKDTGTVIVKGDLQTTGEVTIEGLNFIVAGEIKILDESVLKKCNVFTNSRLFIGDQSRFEGNALAMHSITVFGKAEIAAKSSLIAGSSRSQGSGSSADSVKFSIFLSDEAVVDAVCIALETPGSIKTDMATRITGILWANHLVCHRGTMSGLIYARRVVDCDDPTQMIPDNSMEETLSPDESQESTESKTATTSDVESSLNALVNRMTGSIEPLPEIVNYSLPFFIGRLSIISWREK
jgi:hypothetical protein